jgi:hypothetical protein
MLFHPPNVNGWEDGAWLDTTTMRGRWMIVYYQLKRSLIIGEAAAAYDYAETSDQAVSRALEFWGDPPFSEASKDALGQWGATCLPYTSDRLEASQARAMRQNALRQLIGASPDLQVC